MVAKCVLFWKGVEGSKNYKWGTRTVRATERINERL